MRGRRGLDLPRMKTKTLVFASCALLTVCLAAGLGMRASLTGIGGDPDALAETAFKMSPAPEGMVALYTEQDVVSKMRETGRDLADYTLEEAQDLFAMSMDNVEEIASVIVVGTFTGERTYVYEAFRCEVEITRVVKGEDISAGQTVLIYDPYMIAEPGVYTDSGGLFSSERVVRSNADDHMGGTAPLREGQEYLFFLERKPSPAMTLETSGAYILADHPYARIATDIADHPERIYTVDFDELETVSSGQITEYVMPEMTFGEACDYDVFVQGEDTAELYRVTCREILERVLGKT